MRWWFLIWALGFLGLIGLMLHHHTTTSPDDRWPPGCVVLVALWPLLAALGAIAFMIFWLDEWLWGAA